MPNDIALRIGPISPAASGALYQQIVNGFKREIGEGRLPGGTALPSFRLLAEQLLVSIITVRRAYEELEREGIIFRRQGLGTFVATDGRRRAQESKRRDAEALIRSAVQEAAGSGLNSRQARSFVRRIADEALSEQDACKTPSKSAA
ncbi:MAG: GntR family transcriptional regulator [Gammaproteobacteria bacterium]|nr:GntR family transcriptional regulator [Gammaproteobacteria bacterium]